MLFIDEIHRLNPRRRGDPLPGARGLPHRHRHRPGPGGADARARPAPVHARRRDHAHGAADDAAPRPFRDDVPARLLRARRARAHRAALRADPRRRDRRRGRRGDRPPLARHAARREPHPAPRSRRGRGAPRGRDHGRRSPHEALDLLEVDEHGLERSDRALLEAIVEQVRRWPGRAVDARRRARRGARHDRGRLRAVPAPARLHPAHAARPDRHGARPRPRRRGGRAREPARSACSECPSSGFPARPSRRSTTFVERILRADRALREGAAGGEVQVEIELRDGSVIPLESILPEPGYGFVTLRPQHEAGKEEIVVPVGAIARISLAPPSRSIRRSASRSRPRTSRAVSGGTGARARTARARARAGRGRRAGRGTRNPTLLVVPGHLEEALLDAVVEPGAAEHELAEPVDERLAVDERHALPVADEVRSRARCAAPRSGPSAASSTRSDVSSSSSSLRSEEPELDRRCDDPLLEILAIELEPVGEELDLVVLAGAVVGLGHRRSQNSRVPRGWFRPARAVAWLGMQWTVATGSPRRGSAPRRLARRQRDDRARARPPRIRGRRRGAAASSTARSPATTRGSSVTSTRRAQTIREAIAAGTRICVHGDYDVDGICATALAVSSLRELGADVGWHLPSRFEEGYGLSGQTLARLAEEGYGLDRDRRLRHHRGRRGGRGDSGSVSR